MPTTIDRAAESERMAVAMLKQIWPDVKPRLKPSAMTGTRGIIGLHGTRIDVRSARSYAAGDVAQWRQRALDGMESYDDHVLLIVRADGKAPPQWDAHMPMRQLGIPLYGEGQWVRMELGYAVEVLEYLRRNPRLPFLRKVG